MSDASEKTGSSLAVVEKKSQRPGGCVGIFFQLFDWNRRFAKKKLFSKKLLPPVRVKQSSKKFGGEEKQAKIRLIADENKGGFPTSKGKNGAANSDLDQKHEIRVPGLVARLMGLEAMPTMQRDKSKKVQATGKGEKVVDNVFGYVREELNVEKGGVKHESRPPKLQKTSVPERQAVARFGAEKLPPFKNVLSKSRKYHPKLPNPVRSPRSASRRSSSKLIGAATRILEPGLQTSRSKCALIYSHALDHHMRNDDMVNGARPFSSQFEESDSNFASVAGKGLQCRNCAYLPKGLDYSGQPRVFASSFGHCVGFSCQGSERSKPGHSEFYQGSEEDLHEEYPISAATNFDSVPPHVKFMPYGGHLNEQMMQNSCSQQGNPQKGMTPASFISNRNIQSKDQMLRPRDSLMSDKESKTTVVNGTRNFVVINQSCTGGNRARLPARRENDKFEPEKRIANRLNDSVPPGRKRRPTNISRESAGFVSSPIDSDNYVFSQPMCRKQMGCNAHLINCQRNRRTDEIGQMGKNVAPFAYNSPAKLKSGGCEGSEGKVKNDFHFTNDFQQLETGEHGRRKRSGKLTSLSGDALGALLQQKLKELTSQGEDIHIPKRTAATIFQEIISAFSLEVPSQQDNLPATYDGRETFCKHSHFSNTTSLTKSQANAMARKQSVDQPPLDNEHLSPGSVLEAYFSAESCPSSSSMDDCHGYKNLTESLDCSCCGQLTSNSNPEPCDPVASIEVPKSSKEFVLDIVNSVSEILCCSKLVNYCLGGSNLDRAKRILLNAELVLHNVVLSGSAVGRAFPVRRLLVNELETLASVLWMNFGCSLGIKDGKELNQLARFVFDSVIEHLNSRFEGYPEAIPNVSRKLQPNAKVLIFEIVESVGRWEELSKYCLDDVIEREMNHSSVEWAWCGTEAFKTGMEISRDLYQNLVDEIVEDLRNC